MAFEFKLFGKIGLQQTFAKREIALVVERHFQPRYVVSFEIPFNRLQIELIDLLCIKSFKK